MREYIKRAFAWLWRRQDDFSAEIESHLLLEADRLKGEGLNERDALAAARRSFGNATRAREHFSESRPWFLQNWLGQDLRFGVRILLRNPGLAILATLTFALALGVNTAIFSVLNSALLKPLPVPHPNELVLLTDPNASMMLAGLLNGDRSLLTYPEYEKLRRSATTLNDLCAAQVNLERLQARIADSEPEHTRARFVSESYFSTFGVQPAIGRLFRQSDAAGVGKDPYVVLSYRYWQQRLGGNPAVVGTAIRVDKVSLVIIGVAARSFRGEAVGQEPDLWLPLSMEPLILGFDRLSDTLPNSRDKFMWLHVFGRRKAEKTIGQVQAEVSVLFKAMLEADYPVTMTPEDRRNALNQHLVVRSLGAGVFHGREEFSEQWTFLLALASLILLTASVNVTNLLLARAAARTRETAVRLSIGASRGRLIRQFLTENLLLAALGGILGILLGELILHGLLSLISDANTNFSIAAGLDGRVLMFAVTSTLLAGTIFGAVPAVRGTRGEINEELKVTGWTIRNSRRRATLARSLVITQVAASLVLAVGAGLFLRTLWNLEAVALGYPIDNLLLVQINSSATGNQYANLLRHDVVQRIERVPGVESVSYSDRGLFSGFEGAFAVDVGGFTSNREADRGSTGDSVGPNYFSTIGIPMLMGRQITQQDTAQSPRICVINKAFADHFFAGRNPLGEHVTTTLSDADGKSKRRRLEVIGVAQNARTHSLRGRVEPKFYISGAGPWLEIRTAIAPSSVLGSVRKAIADAGRSIDIQSAKTLRETVSEQNAQLRMIARLAAGFGLLALILAATGLYGVLSYEIRQRTNEIGVRMALGARPRQIAAMILRQTGYMIFAGAAIGITIAAIAARLLITQLYGLGASSPRWSLASYERVESTVQLYGISAFDPVTLLVAVVVIFMAGWFAALFPAARASRIDPVRVLRDE
jgi:predicted permease